MPNAKLPIRSASELLHLRLQALHDAAPRGTGKYVLYWMQQARRLHHNHALQHAVFRAREHKVPLLIFEALRVDYPHASDRHHYFACQAMREHHAALKATSVGYLPYIEPNPGAGRGLLETLCQQAVEVVTDDVPCFIVPGHNRALARIAGEQGIRATAVDGNGLLPTRMLEDPCPSAAVFRRYVHKQARAALASA
ncbi:MAG: deoxyribodipyrimidine photo-lyase, partial [Planctomycetota bacterium]|nr:deoxyribodipyrimidine photo-lyase [Planctomycetota bacterium]